jgi:hypothetical protein
LLLLLLLCHARPHPFFFPPSPLWECFFSPTGLPRPARS